MTQAFHLTDHSQKFNHRLWTLTFDLPGEKVNKLGKAVIDELAQILDQIESQKSKIDVLVLRSGKPGGFIAGADIEMIQSTREEKEAQELASYGHQLLNRWEDLPFPTVAVIEGAALGGGLEWSLASTAIVVSDHPSTKLGLPEVMLGIIPGLGGCIRLPQRLGIAQAFDLILTGKQLNGQRAVRAGLADGIIPKENFQEEALLWVIKNLSTLKKGERIAKEPKLGGMGGFVGGLLEKTPMGRSVIFKNARKMVLKKSKGKYPAPLEAIHVVQKSGVHYRGSSARKWRGNVREKALMIEALGFGKVAVSDVSKNLIRLFFLTEQVKKKNGLPSDRKDVKGRKVDFAGVLGAGVMGGGIAQLFADKQISTRMKDINWDGLELGVQSANAIFKKKLKRKRLNQREVLQRLNAIAPGVDYQGFSATDVVVEAVVENMDIKKKVLSELETHVKEDCVIATNTSSLSVSEMQTVLKKPERFLGMHFFNPVHMMPLVEVIRGKETSDEAVATIYEFSKKLGKTPIVVKDAPGFLVNRLLGCYLNEAAYLLAEGVPIDEIDRALLDFGMPMGPIELIDEVGVDVGEKVGKILFEGFGDRMRPCEIYRSLIDQGRLGKKSKKGFYHWEGHQKSLQSEVYGILGIQPSAGRISPQEIVDRCILPMVNEAARCLEEEVAPDSATVDLGMIMGTGFPPFRGGLLRYADDRGLSSIVDTLKTLEAAHPVRMTPSEALSNRASSGKLFYS